MQFKNKGFEFEDTKKTRKHCVAINDKNKNIVSSMNWKRYLFDRDQNLIFVYDQKRNNFLTNQIFVKIGNINNDYLRYGKNINTNDIFNNWAAKTDNNKSI